MKTQLAPRAVLVEGPDYAELTAFDHYAAWSCSFQASLCLVTGGLMVLGTLGWRAASVGPLLAAVVFVWTRGYRIVVRLERERGEVIQSWLWFRYRRRSFELDAIRVTSAGTGDWGLPGDWPISELCELTGCVHGKHTSVFVGPASAHAEITRALSAQQARLKALGDEKCSGSICENNQDALTMFTQP